MPRKKSYFTIGKEFFKEKKYKKAAEYFLKYVDSKDGMYNIDDVRKLHLMAQCFDKAKMYKEAMKAYYEYLYYTYWDFSIYFPDLHYEVAVEVIAYFIKHKYWDLDYFINGIYNFIDDGSDNLENIDPNNYHPFYFYAMSAMHYHRNNKEKSMEFLKKGLEYYPSSSEVLFQFNPAMKKSKKVLNLLMLNRTEK